MITWLENKYGKKSYPVRQRAAREYAARLAYRRRLSREKVAEALSLDIADVPEFETQEDAMQRIKGLSVEEQNALRPTELPFAPAVTKPLMRLGNTLGEILRDHTPEEVRQARGFGSQNWREFRQFLEKLGRFHPARFS